MSDPIEGYSEVNEHFDKAGANLRRVSEDLHGLLNGDPLDCYRPTALDAMIEMMIQARSLMAIGNYVDDQEEANAGDLADDLDHPAAPR